MLTDEAPDLAARGSDLAVAHRPGASADALVLSRDHHPDAPSHGNVQFDGGRAAGDYLRTEDGAHLNTATLDGG